MDKAKDLAESDVVGPPSQEPAEPRGPSPESPADDPRQTLYDLEIKGNLVESPEDADIDMLDETDYGVDTRRISFVGPVIDRADVLDLLEKEMPNIKGRWFLKGGDQKILSLRSLKLVITHDSENTMIFTADLVVKILNILLKHGLPLDHFPQTCSTVNSSGNLYLVRHDDGQVERVPGVPYKWQLLRRTDEDRREEAAARGGGAQGSP